MENFDLNAWGGAALAIATGIHMLAVLIVNLTDTPSDDGIPGKIYKVVEILAGLFGQKAKQYPGEGGI